MNSPTIRSIGIGTALLPFLVLAFTGLSLGPGLGAGDYAHYLLHARALAEGRSYGDIGYIFVEPAWYVGPAVQPPGLPLFLAPLMAVGAGMPLLRIAMLAFSTMFVVSAAVYFTRFGRWWMGALIALMLGVAPPVVRMSSQVLSDLPFAAPIWALILVYDREKPWTWRTALLASVLGMGVMSMRTAGLAVVPAAFVFALLRREGRGLRFVPLAVWGAVGTVAVGLAGVSLAVRDRIPSIDGALFARVLTRLTEYRVPAVQTLLYPTTIDGVNTVYHVGALALAIVGLAVWTWGNWRSYCAVFAAVYGAMLLVVPVMDGRYLWPLYPLLLFGVLNGLWVVLRRLGRLSEPASAWITVGFAGVVVLGSLTIGPPRERARFLSEQPEVIELFSYLGTAAPEGRVAFVKPRILTWETRIPAMATFNDGNRAIRDVLEDEAITHVVLGDYGLDPSADGAFRRMVESDPGAFTLGFRNEEFEVYAVRALEGAGGNDP